MIYEYACDKCKIETEVVKMSSECSNPEHCVICGAEMYRVWTVPAVSIPQSGYYNHGLGRYISSKQDVKDAQREHKDRTGYELIELGNEKVKPKVSQKYDYGHEAQTAKQLLGV